MTVITKLLVANRGEIACRVIETARSKGYRTVAVYSDADSCARHVKLADEAVRIGPSAVAQSYLDMNHILRAAATCGADAIHPGYGFLSERADFAEACANAGIIFVGPSADAIRAMGDKAESKRRMIAAGVPCVPGYQGEAQDDATLLTEAGRIGYPLMVKASAGGGGRGMRLVYSHNEVAAALRTARSEALTAFGDDRMLLERAIVDPRHVEIQVFGDQLGNVIHLCERDCSVQRRHQKVIEEAPSPAVDADLRARMGEAAVRAASAINYVGAGTVEFLLAPDGNFYFLEMNTRLQVEHPVTELVTGLDLVALQLDVAEGKALPITQDDVSISGHAIEVRLYAEDPEDDFLPQTGEVTVWQPATGTGVRVDHGLVEGAVVSPFYDPMLAKIIAFGSHRDEARRRLANAVRETHIHGVVTNRAFLAATLAHPAFAAGEATTGFIARYFDQGFSVPPAPSWAPALAAMLFGRGTADGWANNSSMGSVVRLEGPGSQTVYRIKGTGEAWSVEAADGVSRLNVRELSARLVRFEQEGHLRRVAWVQLDRWTLEFDIEGSTYRYRDLTLAPPLSAEIESEGGTVISPMNGAVAMLVVEQGAKVKRGDLLLVLEAMKMEHQILAPIDGVAETVAVHQGAQVSPGLPLVIIAPSEDAQ